MSEPDELSEIIEAAKAAILDVMRPEARWTCEHCCQPRVHCGEGGWLNPREVYEQANPPQGSRTRRFKGTHLTIAMCDLQRAGLVEANMRWRVRLPSPDKESPDA